MHRFALTKLTFSSTKQVKQIIIWYLESVCIYMEYVFFPFLFWTSRANMKLSKHKKFWNLYNLKMVLPKTVHFLKVLAMPSHSEYDFHAFSFSIWRSFFLHKIHYPILNATSFQLKQEREIFDLNNIQRHLNLTFIYSDI